MAYGKLCLSFLKIGRSLFDNGFCNGKSVVHDGEIAFCDGDRSIYIFDKSDHDCDKTFYEGEIEFHDGDNLICVFDNQNRVCDKPFHDGDKSFHDGDKSFHEGDSSIHDGDNQNRDCDKSIHDGEKKINEGDKPKRILTCSFPVFDRSGFRILRVRGMHPPWLTLRTVAYHTMSAIWRMRQWSN